MDRTTLARTYYECLDGQDYERLASILADGFVHDRPDLTLEGRDRFVSFMREERPDRETTHDVEAVYRSADGVAVTGRLSAADGGLMTAFLDAFSFDGGAAARGEPRPDDGPRRERRGIQSITTYTRVDADGARGE